MAETPDFSTEHTFENSLYVSGSLYVPAKPSVHVVIMSFTLSFTHLTKSLSKLELSDRVPKHSKWVAHISQIAFLFVTKFPSTRNALIMEDER